MLLLYGESYAVAGGLSFMASMVASKSFSDFNAWDSVGAREVLVCPSGFERRNSGACLLEERLLATQRVVWQMTKR